MPTHDQSQTAKTKRALEAESLHLTVTTTQLQQEAKVVEEQNEHLRELIARKQLLAERLEHALAEARIERRSIEQEVKRVLRPTRRRTRKTSEAVR